MPSRSFIGLLSSILVVLPALSCSDDASTGPTPSEPPAISLVRAGWSFGFCLGACLGELRLDAGQTIYTVSERGGTQLGSNRASLTSAGQSRLSELERALPRNLQAVYGCPDCADGGASFVVLSSADVESESRYEFGRPPAELVELDQFLTEIMDALRQCRANTVVTLSGTCNPLVR